MKMGGLLGSKEESLEPGIAEKYLLNPYSVTAPGCFVFGQGATVVDFAVAANECNAAPTLSWHSEDCPLPFQRIPWESCGVEFLQIKMFSAYLARSFVAPTVMLLAESSLLLAFACLPQLWPAANSASSLLHLAIAVEELVIVPLADSMDSDLFEVEVAVAAAGAMSWPLEEANLYEE